MSYPQGQYPDPNQQQPWGSPQQGQGYGNQGYPQSGGGYGQDPYGQPQQPGYPQQQPGYPPTSGSPYGQPAQPQYPGYGDQSGYPQSGGGAYGQDPYGQPQQQQPGWYGTPTPTPPQKSRAPLIIGVVVLAILVLGGAATTVFFVTRDNTTTAGPSSGPSGRSTTTGTKAPTTGSTTGGTTKANVTFASPDKIGTYKKSADDSTAQTMRSQMQAAGLSDPFSAVYDDTAADGQRVVMWGGAGSIFAGSPDTQLNAFFTSAAKSLNGTLGPKVTADAGSLGGKAQCTKVNGTGATLAMCAWSGSNALLGFIFNAITPEKAAQQVKAILPVVVVKS